LKGLRKKVKVLVGRGSNGETAVKMGFRLREKISVSRRAQRRTTWRYRMIPREASSGGPL